MSKEEIRKLLPMEFYAKEDMEIYTEISLVTLNEIMKYISNKEQIIDKAYNSLGILLQILEEQSDDKDIKWILERLNPIQEILGGNNG